MVGTVKSVRKSRSKDRGEGGDGPRPPFPAVSDKMRAWGIPSVPAPAGSRNEDLDAVHMWTPLEGATEEEGEALWCLFRPRARCQGGGSG